VLHRGPEYGKIYLHGIDFIIGKGEQVKRLKGIKHIMNFGTDDLERIKLDRVCRMLRAMDGVSYETSTHPDETGVVLWAHGTTRRGITKALHQELKARAIGIAFALDNQAELVGSPTPHNSGTPMIIYGGPDAFVTLASEETR